MINYNLTKNCIINPLTNTSNCSAFLTFSNSTQENTIKSPGFVALVQVLGMFVCLTVASTIYWCCIQCRIRASYRFLNNQLPSGRLLHHSDSTISPKMRTILGKETDKVEEMLRNSYQFVRDNDLNLGWGHSAHGPVNFKALVSKKAVALQVTKSSSNRTFSRKSSESVGDFVLRLKSHSVALKHLGSLCDEYTALCDKAMYGPQELTSEDFEKAEKYVSMIKDVLERSAS
jgi:hypothetical protein